MCPIINLYSRYEISSDGSSDRATSYFSVDEESGEISVADDLTKEVYEDYRVRKERLKILYLWEICTCCWFAVANEGVRPGRPPARFHRAHSGKRHATRNAL